MPVRPDISERVTAAARAAALQGVPRLLVGFSGGADSTALLVLLHEVHPCVTAVHLHHGLRGQEADADAQWCERFCREREWSYEQHALDVPQNRRAGESLEQAARRCRLEFWAAHCEQDDCVALAHHADDCLENLFLRLARGSNCSGLTGLRSDRVVCGVRFLRPLLEISRAEIEQFLRSRGISDWRVDSSNADHAMLRNAVRHRLLPLWRELFGGDAALGHALHALRDDAECLEALADSAAAGEGTLQDWRALPPALLPRVLRAWLSREAGREVVPDHQAVARLRDALASLQSGRILVPISDFGMIAVDGSGVRNASAASLPPWEVEWHWRDDAELRLPHGNGTLHARVCDEEDPAQRGNAWVEFFDVDAVPEALLVRSRRQGDVIRPFGADFTRKLQDVFVDAKVPRDRRDMIPIVCADSAIVWAAGVRRAEFARVGKGRKTLRLEFSREER